MNPKPGWTTTEWLLTFVYVGTMVIAGIGALGLEPDHWLVKVGAFVAAARVITGYWILRSGVESLTKGKNGEQLLDQKIRAQTCRAL